MLEYKTGGLMTEKVFSPVKYCLKSEANPFSITCELSKGATLGNDAHKNITLKKGDDLVVFDDQVKTKDGWVAGEEVLPVPPNDM